jgi:3-oxoadipate enol-lactonase
MADLGADTVALLDGLQIERAHYVGLSLGAMSGFGLAIEHADRLLSACLCAGRADAPGVVASVWDERIAQAEQHGTQSLGPTTIERWYGQPFVADNPVIAARFLEIIGGTSVDGFTGAGRAIQKLDFIGRVQTISVPVTLLVGANDGPLPDANRQLAALIPRAVIEIVPGAGHLPNIDQPERFNSALYQHLERNQNRLIG